MAGPTLADHARRAYVIYCPGEVYARSTQGVVRYADSGGDRPWSGANGPRPATCRRSVPNWRIWRVVRLREYYRDANAPRAHDVLPAAFAAVRNSSGELLLVRRIDDGNWELPGGRIEVGESVSEAVVREGVEGLRQVGGQLLCQVDHRGGAVLGRQPRPLAQCLRTGINCTSWDGLQDQGDRDRPLEVGGWRPRIVCGRVDTTVLGVQGAPNPSRVSCVRNTETPSGPATP